MIFKNIYLEILRVFFKDTFSSVQIFCLAKDIYERYILVLFLNKFYEFEMSIPKHFLPFSSSFLTRKLPWRTYNYRPIPVREWTIYMLTGNIHIAFQG